MAQRLEERVKRAEGMESEYVITYQGKPAAILLPVAEEDVEDYLLAHHPHFVALREQAREAIQRGEFMTSTDLRSLLKE